MFRWSTFHWNSPGALLGPLNPSWKPLGDLLWASRGPLRALLGVPPVSWTGLCSSSTWAWRNTRSD